MQSNIPSTLPGRSAEPDDTVPDAYSAAVARFTDGVRNLSLAASLVQDIELPDEYTDASVVAPSCAE